MALGRQPSGYPGAGGPGRGSTPFGPCWGPASPAFLSAVLVLLLVGKWRLKFILVQMSGLRVLVELLLCLAQYQSWSLLLGLLLCLSLCLPVASARTSEFSS